MLKHAMNGTGNVFDVVSGVVLGVVTGGNRCLVGLE